MTEHQVGLDPVLQRGQARLLQARDLALSERLIREIGERLAAPQPQRRVQQLARAQKRHRRRARDDASAAIASKRSTST